MRLIPEYKSDFHQFLNYVTCFIMAIFIFLMVVLTLGIEIFGFNENELLVMFIINLFLGYLIIKYLDAYGEKIE